MTYKDYLGDLIGGGLMIRESQLIAALLLTKPDQAAWDNAITNQNILQKRSEASAKRNAATIKKRLATVNDAFLEKLAYGNTELSTQLIFAATLINSTILADFMRSVYSAASLMPATGNTFGSSAVVYFRSLQR